LALVGRIDLEAGLVGLLRGVAEKQGFGAAKSLVFRSLAKEDLADVLMDGRIIINDEDAVVRERVQVVHRFSLLFCQNCGSGFRSLCGQGKLEDKSGALARAFTLDA